jgi:hypothetical protein
MFSAHRDEIKRRLDPSPAQSSQMLANGSGYSGPRGYQVSSGYNAAAQVLPQLSTAPKVCE